MSVLTVGEDTAAVFRSARNRAYIDADLPMRTMVTCLDLLAPLAKYIEEVVQC